MPSKHPWKFVSSGIDMVGASLQNDWPIEKWEKGYLQDLLISIGYFEEAKFTWIGMTIRYGTKNERKTHFQGICKKYGDLDLAKELDMRILMIADKNDIDMLMDFFKIAYWDSLIDAGKKYKLKESAIETLKQERAKLGEIPDWIPEMEENPQLVIDKYKESTPK